MQLVLESGRRPLAVAEKAPGPISERRKRWAIRWWHVRNALRYRRHEPILLAFLFAWHYLGLSKLLRGLSFQYGKLYLRKVGSDGTVWDYGLVGRDLVVTAGKNYLASCMDNTAEPEALKYHGFGTGTTAAAAGDTALQTECTTAYATDNTRPTGSQAHSTNTYTTVATFTPDAAVACTEWGLLTQASNAGGTLLDHQVFSAVNLNGSGDSLATTYVLTFS